MSITTYLTALDRDKDNLAANLTAKGVPASSSETFTSLVPKVLDIPSGSSAVPKKDVNFYDYDGTVVASYTASEFAELTEMPANPTHEGLTAQGWNWSLADAKTYVATYSKLNIGQMYITSDGKTRLYIELTEGRLQPYLKLCLNANSELDIDWGDGSTHSTFTNTDSSESYKNEMHTYASAGSYIIAISVVSGGFELHGSEIGTDMCVLLTNDNALIASPDTGYLNSIKKVEIGSGITGISVNAFRYCYSLTSITIPDSITSIGNYAFGSCYSLTSITIPDGVTSIGDAAFSGCHLLSSITIPDSVTSIGLVEFQNCYLLTSITIPVGVTSIERNTFRYCYSLTSIAIPSSVTSIDTNVFQYCYFLATITIHKATDSISGSPWGASTSSPTSTQIVWTG